MSGTDDSPHRIRLHYENVGKRGHTLPAHVLVKSLQQVQRIVYLLAKFHQGDELGQRARPSHDLEQRFALICQVPEAGSYALPADIGDPSTKESFDDGDIGQVSRLFQQVSEAVNEGDLLSLREQIPDGAYRKSLIEAYKAAQPPKRSGVVLSIEDYKHRKLLNGFHIADAFAKLDSRSVKSNGRDTPAYVTGTLVRMNFEERRLHLKLLSGRAFQATYSDDFEPDLLDHPRDLIQVYGDVTYDEDGVPTSLTEVDQIIEVNESPIQIREFVFGDARYHLDPPLSFEVSFNREDHLYDLCGDFEVKLSAESRPDLEDALDDSLVMLWTEYAQEQPSRLSPKAQELRSQLLGRFRKIINGS